MSCSVQRSVIGTINPLASLEIKSITFASNLVAVLLSLHEIQLPLEGGFRSDVSIVYYVGQSCQCVCVYARCSHTVPLSIV